jgi:hypothetical protein
MLAMTKTTTSTDDAQSNTIAENKQEKALWGHQEALESSEEGYKGRLGSHTDAGHNIC